MRRPPIQDSIASLCPGCGLCCNGTLFEDVRLRTADQPLRLRQLGLPLARLKGSPCLTQPCAAFDGSLCRIYPDRPGRCRDFVCGLLQRVIDGSLSPTAARRRITHTRKLAEQLRRDLDALGAADPSLPLVRRFTAAMSQPIDLADGPSASRLRGRLMKRMDALMAIAREEFLSPPTTRPRP